MGTQDVNNEIVKYNKGLHHSASVNIYIQIKQIKK